jgi:hypothetical protein
MIISFVSGVALSILSAWWVLACTARRAIVAAVLEGLWALAIVAGVGASFAGLGPALAFALGAAAGTWIVVSRAAT